MQPTPPNTDFSTHVAQLVNLPTASETTLMGPGTADDQRPSMRLCSHKSPKFSSAASYCSVFFLGKHARKHFYIHRTIFMVCFGNVSACCAEEGPRPLRRRSCLSRAQASVREQKHVVDERVIFGLLSSLRVFLFGPPDPSCIGALFVT